MPTAAAGTFVAVKTALAEKVFPAGSEDTYQNALKFKLSRGQCRL
jgi:hypothetical protein